MAKTKDPAWKTCEGYKLVIDLTDVGKFQLDPVNPDEANLNLLETDKDQSAQPLVKKALKIIAECWPNVDWEYQVDEGNHITDIRAKPAS